jgi:hypothetical protein
MRGGRVLAGKKEVTIKIDDSFTDPACNFCVGFLRFGVEDKRETAGPAGTGTFVKLGNVCGILTAAHVLRPMRSNETVGLVRFPRIQPVLQNYRLNLDHTERIEIWSGESGEAPDICAIPAMATPSLGCMATPHSGMATAGLA